MSTVKLQPSSGPFVAAIFEALKIISEVASVTSAARRNLDAVKAQIVALSTEASIATFLSGVQAQIIALTFTNNSTRLKVAANAFGFMGLMWDVIAAFLGLYTSTIFQRNVSAIEKEIAHLTDPSVPQDHLDEFIHHLDSAWHKHSDHLSPLCVGLIRTQILPRFKNPPKESSNDEKHVDDRFLSEDKPDFKEFIRACHAIDEASVFGQVVGAAMVFGVICFLGSALFLAISTQPKEAYIPCAVALACVVLLPLLNMVLAHRAPKVTLNPLAGLNPPDPESGLPTVHRAT
jgi:hypothetical protein